jgi:hypothetical protein
MLTRGNETPCLGVMSAREMCKKNLAQNHGNDTTLFFFLQCDAWLTT